MKRVYKYINIVVLAMLATSLFSSCGSTGYSSRSKSKTGCREKMEVVTPITETKSL